MWVNELEVAIIEQDTAKVESLVENMPSPANIEEADRMACLLREVALMLENLKNETALAMRQVKQSLDYLDATQLDPQKKIDITS